MSNHFTVKFIRSTVNSKSNRGVERKKKHFLPRIVSGISSSLFRLRNSVRMLHLYNETGMNNKINLIL